VCTLSALPNTSIMMLFARLVDQSAESVRRWISETGEPLVAGGDGT